MCRTDKKNWRHKKGWKYLKKTELEEFIIFYHCTNCGLRISDILALNVSDVKNKNFIQITEKKTGKFKKFPINSKLKPLFAKYTKGKNLDSPLFETKFGNRLERVAVLYYKKYLCRSRSGW